MKCIKCKSVKISMIAVIWYNDKWLYYNCECEPWLNRHRTNNERIKEQKQPEINWPVYFKTRTKYFKNLNEITEEEYNVLSVKRKVHIKTWNQSVDDLFWWIFKK